MYRDGSSEVICKCSVAGHQLVELLAGERIEDIRGPGVGAVVVVAGGRDNDQGSIDGARDSEEIVAGPVTGDELADELPGRDVKDVGGSHVVVAHRADDGKFL